MSEQFNGTVRVKDGNKAPQDYGVNREVEVSISFFCDSAGQLDDFVDRAAKAADAKVNELLGRTTEPKPERQRRTTVPKVEKTADPAAMTVEPAKKENPVAADPKPGKAAADPAAMTEAAPASGQAISTGEERSDPAAMDASLFSSTVPTISDNDLMATITQHNAKTKNAPAIRALIGKYVPQDGKPHQAAEIVQEKRQAFKDELGKIGAPA